jgi:hypothetical protein
LEGLNFSRGIFIFEFMLVPGPIKAAFLAWMGFLFFQVSLQAQDVPGHDHVVDTIVTSLDIFDEQDPMEVTLILDLKKFQREKFKGEYIPATFIYHLNDTLTQEHSIRIKARGNFRRQHCSFAPFWLNIRKADVANEHLQNINRIKVVTHCNGSRGYADYVLKEYLTYRIYNLLSPVSFRVRLLKMRYVDTGRKNRVTENWAFMIEPEELLAERLEGIAVKRDDLSMRHMVAEDMDRVAQFMYMIGNPDYSITGRHNVKILGIGNYGGRGYTPVPYDFDYSGLVNTYYAIPSDDLGIESVRERFYLGACRSDQAYQRAMDELAGHREEILNLVQEFPLITDKVSREMVSYLESYFMEAEGRNFIKFNLRSTCR